MNIYDLLNKADAWFESSSLDAEIPAIPSKGMVVMAGYIAIIVFLILIIGAIKGKRRKR